MPLQPTTFLFCHHYSAFWFFCLLSFHYCRKRVVSLCWHLNLLLWVSNRPSIVLHFSCFACTSASRNCRTCLLSLLFYNWYSFYIMNLKMFFAGICYFEEMFTLQIKKGSKLYQAQPIWVLMDYCNSSKRT